MAHDSEPARMIVATLKNGGASNFAVNGSVTPQVFAYSPPADFDVVLLGFSLLFETNNAFAFGNKFLDTTIATLTNGLLLDAKSNDLAFTWQNMKRSRDVVEISESFDIITGTPNFLRVTVKLPHELRLVKAGAFVNPDFLQLTIRDNLSAFAFAEAFFQGVKL